MKKIAILLLLISQGIFAQEATTDNAVDFNTADETPLTPNCHLKRKNYVLKKCVSKTINSHIAQNFDVDVALRKKLEGVIKIENTFIVNTKGEITNIVSITEDEDVKQEAIKTLKALPKMTPGKHKGKLVNVKFNYPIAFSVTE